MLRNQNETILIIANTKEELRDAIQLAYQLTENKLPIVIFDQGKQLLDQEMAAKLEYFNVKYSVAKETLKEFLDDKLNVKSQIEQNYQNSYYLVCYQRFEAHQFKIIAPYSLKDLQTMWERYQNKLPEPTFLPLYSEKDMQKTVKTNTDQRIQERQVGKVAKPQKSPSNHWVYAASLATFGVFMSMHLKSEVAKGFVGVISNYFSRK